MKLKVSFTTCTIMEAIDEINIVLDAANYPRVTESNLINTTPVEKNTPDDFDDFRFVFELEIDDTIDNIKEKIMSKGIDVDYD